MEARLLSGIDRIEAPVWDGLVPGDDPFVRHVSRADGGERLGHDRSGWQPLHLVLEEGGRPVGAVPLYAKSHSWGEYVFDHGWADAFERTGGRYYPKLQAAVPFTPVPGPRLLSGGDPAVGRALASALALTARETGLSSLHVTFCSEEDAAALAGAGFRAPRHPVPLAQSGLRQLSDFLGELRSAKRKTIRKERELGAGGRGRDPDAQRRRAGPPRSRRLLSLLSGDGRQALGQRLPDAALLRAAGAGLSHRVVYVAARKDGETVAAALNLWAGDTLYGRLWGCLESYRFLHFECCYYAAIDFAIANGLARVEAGARAPTSCSGATSRSGSGAPAESATAASAPPSSVSCSGAAPARAQILELREQLPYRQAEGCPS